MGREVVDHPDVKILNVGVGIDQAAYFEDVGILRQKSR